MKSNTVDLILKIGLFVVIAALGYWLYHIIREPIIAERIREIRKQRVIERMEYIRTSQFAYKDLNDRYAEDWDDLIQTVKNDSFSLVKTLGDPNDTTVQIRRDTTYVAIRDSLFPKNYPIDSIRFSPNTGGKEFLLEAGTITQRGVEVNVFQVTDPVPLREDFTLQLGSMSEAVYSGNWK